MIMVSVGAFDWHSVRLSTLRRMPKSETSVMLVTVVLTVATDNLAIGVVAGVLTAFVLFARCVAHLTTLERLDASDDDGLRVYRLTGELFFASPNDLVTQFAY